MDFTFGIITGGSNEDNLNKIVDSIELQLIPSYEIIIVGNCNINRKNTKVIDFDESIKSKWITKKKNIITKKSQYENVVYLHDYLYLDSNWYQNFLIYGNDFDLCMNKIINKNGERFRDWTLWPPDIEKKINSRGFIIPYNMTHLSSYMYFSGAYWVAKKEVMLKFPLDESLSWGEGEDVLWSKQVRQSYIFKINENSIVHLLKHKNKEFNFSSIEDIEILNKIK